MKNNSIYQAVLLGALLGMSHALAQCTMMGISGLSLDLRFILSESVVYILAGGVLGLVLQTVSSILSPLLAGRRENSQSELSAGSGRPVSILVLYFAGLVAYSILVLVFRTKSYSWQNILPVLAVSGLIFWLFLRFVSRRVLILAAWVVSIVTVSFLACATCAYLVLAPEIISENGSLIFGLAVVSPFLAGVVLVPAVGRLNFMARGWLSNQRVVYGAALPVLLAVNILAWCSVMPCRAGWFIFESTVTRWL